MKKILLGISVLALGACTYSAPLNNEGFYSEMDLTAVDWSTVNRSGSACQLNIFGLIPVGDNSVPRAVKNAKIEKLLYVDTKYTLYFPVMSRECTNVWGMGMGSAPVTTATTSQSAKAQTTDTKKAKK